MDRQAGKGKGGRAPRRGGSDNDDLATDSPRVASGRIKRPSNGILVVTQKKCKERGEPDHFVSQACDQLNFGLDLVH